MIYPEHQGTLRILSTKMSDGYKHLGKPTICCVKMVFSQKPAKMFGAVGTLCPLREVAADKLQVLQSSCLQHFNISLYTTFHFVFQQANISILVFSISPKLAVHKTGQMIPLC